MNPHLTAFAIHPRHTVCSDQAGVGELAVAMLVLSFNVVLALILQALLLQQCLSHSLFSIRVHVSP